MAPSGGQRVNRIQDLVGHSGRINCLKFGPGSNPCVATGGNDRKVLIWKLKSKNPLLVLNGLANAVEALTFEPAGKLVAAGSSSGTVKLWDLAEGKVSRTLTGHKQSTVALQFHLSSQIIATGALDSTAKLWDLRQRECTHTLRVDSTGVTSLQFSPDCWLATGEQDGTLQIWDVFSGKKLSEMSHRAHEDQVTSIAFHPEELLLASGSADRTCKLWDLETNDLVSSFEQEGKMRSVKFSMDGRALFTSHTDAVRVWGWEPTRFYDTVSLSAAPAQPSKLPAQPLSAAADLCFVEDHWQLMGGSLGHSTASIWSIDLQRVEPFQKNEVDERGDTGTPMQPQHPGGEPSIGPVVSAGSSSGPETTAQDTVLADLADRAGREEAQSREPCPLSREAFPDSLPDQGKHPGRALFADAPAMDREARGAQAEPVRNHRASEGRHEEPGEARGRNTAMATSGTPLKQIQHATPRESPGPRFLTPTASWRLRSQAAATEAAPLAQAKEPADSAAPVSGRSGALFDLSPNKRAGTRSARRSSCGSAAGAQPQPGRPGSPMRLKKVVTLTGDENKHAYAMEAAGRPGSAKALIAKTTSVTASNQARKPWSPSIVVKHAAKGTTPEKPLRSTLRQAAVGTPGAARAALGTPSQAGRVERTPTSVQQSLSVLGHTAWVVPLKGPPVNTPEAPSHMGGAGGPSRPAVAPASASTVPLAPSLATTSGSSSGSTVYGSPLTEELSGPLSSCGSGPGSQGPVPKSFDAPSAHLNTSGGTSSGLMRSLIFSEQSPASQSHNQAPSAPSPIFPQRPSGGAPSPSPPSAGASGPLIPGALTPSAAPSDATPGNERSGPGMPLVPSQQAADRQDSQAWQEGQSQAPVTSDTPFTPQGTGLKLDGSSPSAATGTPQHHPQPSGGRNVGPVVGASPATPASAHGEQGPSAHGHERRGGEGVAASVRTHHLSSSVQKGAPPAHAQVTRPAATPSSFSQFLRASQSTGAGAFDQAALHQPSPVTGLNLASSAVGQEVGAGDSSASGAEGTPGPASLDTDALFQHLSFRHTEVMSLLAMRRRQLQEAKLLWAGGEGAETMRLLAKWKDPHVLVAVVGAMVTNGDPAEQPFSAVSRGRGREMPAASSNADSRWLSIGLAGCAPLLTLLKDLLPAPYPFYVETCVQALQDILRCHGQTLHDLRTAPVGPGVDLHRDARRLLCEQCLTSLEAMRGPLEALTRTQKGTTSTRAASVLRGIDAVLSK